MKQLKIFTKKRKEKVLLDQAVASSPLINLKRSNMVSTRRGTTLVSRFLLS
ncbi:hypothetical protein BAOM_1891 [Peribacillus asahii]|uniref:Uncharacterized protein n=1 Tax=Peribacillus asahii TaxID=228899 RepID=A0A3T0KQL0_9BACI|nr:hypothetical protein BAOM_1891 [Peribacillus asahii]